MTNKKRPSQIIALTSFALLIGLGLTYDGVPSLPGGGGATQREWVVTVSGFLPGGDGSAAGAFTVLAPDRIAAQNEGRRLFLDRFPDATVFSVAAVRKGRDGPAFVNPTI